MPDIEIIKANPFLRPGRAEEIHYLWDEAYPAMRKIVTLYIEGMRAYVERESWKVDPDHPQAEILQAYATPEDKARRKLKLAEELRRDLGQLDRGTHRACTRSPGGFSVTAAYMAVRNLLNRASLNSYGMPGVFRLAAVLAEANEEADLARAARRKD